MKKITIIPALALALLLALSFATAQAQTETAEAGKINYSPKLESLQDQLWAKRMELQALVQAGNAKEVKAATDEVIKLRNQVREERRQLAGPDGAPGGKRGGKHGGWGKGGWGPGGCPCQGGGW